MLVVLNFIVVTIPTNLLIKTHKFVFFHPENQKSKVKVLAGQMHQFGGICFLVFSSL